MNTVEIFMIVDDDRDDITLMSEAIQKMCSSSKFVFAHNGEEALYKLKNELLSLPDYLFLDLNMPGMGGKAFLSKIKKDVKLKNIPIVIASTSSNYRDREETRKLGAVHFMTKPSSFSDLCSEIIEIVTRLRKIQTE